MSAGNALFISQSWENGLRDWQKKTQINWWKISVVLLLPMSKGVRDTVLVKQFEKELQSCSRRLSVDFG